VNPCIAQAAPEQAWFGASCAQSFCDSLGGHLTNWEQIENKLGTNYRSTPVKWVDQHVRKSLRGKDGLVFYPAHNPKVVSSNLTPAPWALERKIL
jgi:hypothetical protein